MPTKSRFPCAHSRSPLPLVLCLCLWSLLAAFLSFATVKPVMAGPETPLRVHIRAGEKTHGPGAHDFPAFLSEWTQLLKERGAEVSGGLTFPSQEVLEKTDVLILHSQESGNIEGEERKNLEAFLAHGGGLVVVHAGVASRVHDWYSEVIGGSWKFGQTKYLEGEMSLYFTDRDNPITAGCSNFDLDDEMYFDMDMKPGANILAAAYTPKNKEGAMPEGEKKEVNIYDIQPQMWTYEKDNYRAFVSLPGHWHKNFSHNSLRTLLLRGIAWAGKRADVNELCKPEELGEALRYPVGGPTRPEKAAEKIEVHPEFTLSLVASEPLINKPINLDWDEQGRLWVVETPEYPNGLRKANTDVWKEMGSLNPGVTDRKPQDRISILTDEDGDGVMDKKHVFADGLELATSFVFYGKGVIVSAAPDIWFLEDTDGDSVVDVRKKLYTGLGTFDTHAVLNNLRWGLDGWIYGTHGYSAGDVTALGAHTEGEAAPVRISSGVVRFRPDGSKIEMYSSRNGNTWGLTMTSDGQCFWTQPTSGTLFFHTVLPEHILALGSVPGTTSWKGMIEKEKVYPLMHWEQQAYRQIDLVGSYTAAAGCAIYEGGAWPDKWNYSYFAGEPTINIISQYFITPDGVSYQAHREKGREQTEFVRSSDLWFRPIENRVGPDGALYVLDFYNQAVIHNDTRGPLHGPANAAVRPDRDHYFGRIWRIQHRDAKTIAPVPMDRDKPETLQAGLKSPNGHTRQLALRLLRETGQDAPKLTIGSKVQQAYEAHKQVKTEADREKVVQGFAKAGDDWTRSAYVAIANQDPLAFLDTLLQSGEGDSVAQLAGLLTATATASENADVAALVHAVASHLDGPVAPRVAVLDRLAAIDAKAGIKTVPATEDLRALLASPALARNALPIAIQWDTDGKLKAEIDKELSQLTASLQDPKAEVKKKIEAVRLLAKTGAQNAYEPLLEILLRADTHRDLQDAIIRELGQGGGPLALVDVFSRLAPQLRGLAFGEIVKRPDASLALLDRIADGSVKVADLGPANVSRLRAHPDLRVSSRAESMLDELIPGTKEKKEIIEKLLPEVSQPGDIAKGRALFQAACAICHQYGDLAGVEVGPPLTGMGSHAAQELLTHIVDPNREVDPSFWQWNVKLKNGDTLAGVIVRENPAGFTLRNQGGDVEVRKEDVAERINTRRSLMPEGLEQLGAEGLRDLLSFLAAEDGRYRVLDLRGAYTADSRRGLFASAEEKSGSVFPVRFGNISSHDVPFFFMDAKVNPSGLNLVVLKGGPKESASQSYPQKVEVPVQLTATRFYLLSGIAGWGYPAVGEEIPILKITTHYADGSQESTELRNKIEFADYNRVISIPGSELAEGVVKRGQARIITLQVKKNSPVKSLTLESYDNWTAPVVIAITADLSSAAPAVQSQAKSTAKETEKETKASQGKAAEKANEAKDSAKKPSASMATAIDLSKEAPNSTAATGLRFVEPRAADDVIRVLLVGAGASHHFPRDFIAADLALLKNTPKIDAIGTMNLEEALARLPEADVLVFSGNHDQWGEELFQKALHDFADAGKGLIFVHAATWAHPWEGYNQRFISGGTKAHGFGDVTSETKAAEHPILKGVPATFHIEDESYHFHFFDKVDSTVLVANQPDGKSPETHPALWLVKDPKARIVCYTHGHAEAAHANANYQAILRNAIRWAGRSE